MAPLCGWGRPYKFSVILQQLILRTKLRELSLVTGCYEFLQTAAALVYSILQPLPVGLRSSLTLLL
jgi:hypothetical protein